MRTNIEILESLSVNHKKLKEDKPYLLFKILKAMDIARTEQLTLTDVVKPLKDNEALTFEDWIKSNNYTDDFDGDFRKRDKIVGSVEVLKRYNKYLQSL